jgi:hypothetical protein
MELSGRMHFPRLTLVSEIDRVSEPEILIATGKWIRVIATRGWPDEDVQG